MNYRDMTDSELRASHRSLTARLLRALAGLCDSRSVSRLQREVRRVNAEMRARREPVRLADVLDEMTEDERDAAEEQTRRDYEEATTEARKHREAEARRGLDGEEGGGMEYPW